MNMKTFLYVANKAHTCRKWADGKSSVADIVVSMFLAIKGGWEFGGVNCGMKQDRS